MNIKINQAKNLRNSWDTDFIWWMRGEFKWSYREVEKWIKVKKKKKKKRQVVMLDFLAAFPTLVL